MQLINAVPFRAYYVVIPVRGANLVDFVSYLYPRMNMTMNFNVVNMRGTELTTHMYY